MKRQLILFFSLLCFFTAAFAAPASPVPVLEHAATQLISKLQQNKSQLKSNPTLINGFVRTIVLPLVAQQEMAQSVVNRSLWNNATDAQRQQFVKQFSDLVIRTYAAAFSNYTNETVKFNPVRAGQLGQKYGTVTSMIIRPGAQPIPVTYALELINGKWVVTDFSVDGVSMVNSFKSQIASLENNKGLAGVTAILEKHNNKRK